MSRRLVKPEGWTQTKGMGGSRGAWRSPDEGTEIYDNGDHILIDTDVPDEGGVDLTIHVVLEDAGAP